MFVNSVIFLISHSLVFCEIMAFHVYKGEVEKFKGLNYCLMTMQVHVVAKMIPIIFKTIISKNVAIAKTIATVREISMVILLVYLSLTLPLFIYIYIYIYIINWLLTPTTN